MFFLVKVGEEIAHGDFSNAFKTLTGGVAPEVQTIEDDAAAAFKAFLAVAGPAEAKTLLSSLATTLTNGIKAGVTALEGGTVVNAEAGATAAAGAIVSTD